ncbi:DUF7386 family protein [Natrinema caseinilyticum]|uniref:DUF7386 family protein n=1 Tax=Natrinema caseinilyticum TaxID=2961570 RepID=UPI003CCE3718
MRRIEAEDEYDAPPTTVVIDGALTHRIEFGSIVEDARGESEPESIRAVADGSGFVRPVSRGVVNVNQTIWCVACKASSQE